MSRCLPRAADYERKMVDANLAFLRKLPERSRHGNIGRQIEHRRFGQFRIYDRLAAGGRAVQNIPRRRDVVENGLNLGRRGLLHRLRVNPRWVKAQDNDGCRHTRKKVSLRHKICTPRAKLHLRIRFVRGCHLVNSCMPSYFHQPPERPPIPSCTNHMDTAKVPGNGAGRATSGSARRRNSRAMAVEPWWPARCQSR